MLGSQTGDDLPISVGLLTMVADRGGISKLKARPAFVLQAVRLSRPTMLNIEIATAGTKSPPIIISVWPTT